MGETGQGRLGGSRGQQACADMAASVCKAGAGVATHRQVGQLGGPERSWKARFCRMQVLQSAQSDVAGHRDVGQCSILTGH